MVLTKEEADPCVADSLRSASSDAKPESKTLNQEGHDTGGNFSE